MNVDSDTLDRIVAALEKIATALEGGPTKEVALATASIPISLTIDGSVLARQVARHSLRQAAKGPVSVTGGRLSADSNG